MVNRRRGVYRHVGGVGGVIGVDSVEKESNMQQDRVIVRNSRSSGITPTYSHNSKQFLYRLEVLGWL